MSDKPEKMTFTEREMQLLAFAMQSIKGGPPEIDYEKMAQLAGMSNPRSCSNAWAAIKKKLAAGATGTAGDGEGKTPKKKNTGARKAAKSEPNSAGEDNAEDKPEPTPKKTPRAKKTAIKSEPASCEEEVEAAPKKTPRKRAAKTNDNEGSPKKRGRPAKAKPVQEEREKDEEWKDDTEASAAATAENGAIQETDVRNIPSLFGDGKLAGEENAEGNDEAEDDMVA